MRFKPFKIKQEDGFSLVEIMVVSFMGAIIMLAVVSLLRPTLIFFKRSQVRQQAESEAQRCLLHLTSVLNKARPSTVSIFTPDTGAISPRPNSSVQFFDVSNTSYTITWSTAPLNSVHVLEHAAPYDATTPTYNRIIANDISGLIFTQDIRDPGIMYVTIELDLPLDGLGRPDSLFTLLFPNQTIYMNKNQ